MRAARHHQVGVYMFLVRGVRAYVSTRLIEIRPMPMRNVEQLGGGNLMEKQSLEAVEELWNGWEIQCLMLVSFGLQVFLFLAADMRRHSTSRVLRSLLWLAYLSADSVAVFVLGHLAVHASGPRHQLLLFWAPFVLLHLGGQDTMTAFSMQDNELWTRHLLGLVTQVAVAGYVVSRSSWPDRRLMAATVLMFITGCFKYAERTCHLYIASSARLMDFSLSGYQRTVHRLAQEREDSTAAIRLRQRIDVMITVDGRRPSVQTLDPLIELVSDTPVNDKDIILGADALPGLLQVLKSSADRCRVYDYVGAMLVRCYEFFYTKAAIHEWIIVSLGDMGSYSHDTILLLTFLVVFFLPLLSSSTALVLFMVTGKGQLYSRADVTVSYILLLGAIILEVASLFMSILSFFASSDAQACCPLTRLVSRVANFIHPAGRRRKQWSEMLAQYNMVKSYNKQDAAGIVSFVPQWISKHLDDKTVTHIPVTEDLKKLVLDRLLDFGTGDQKDWNFASFRGQLALWRCPALRKIINDVDFPTSVLIWHVATDICYFSDNISPTSYQINKRRMCRELSNYIMYLVFKCGVMLTSSSKLVHVKTCKEMEKSLTNQDILGEKSAMKIVFEANKHVHQPADMENPTSSSSQQTTHLQLLKDNMKALDSPLLPRACAVAKELDGIHEEAHRWDLIAAVWLEMLFYIAPRCGIAFHCQHLCTGGEFISHVAFLMRELGPFLPTPGA